MREADPAVLQQVMEAEGIRSSPATPSRLAWLVDRIAAFFDGLGARVGAVPGMGELVWAIAAVLAAILVVLTLFALWRLATVIRRGQRPDVNVPAPVVVALDLPDARRFRAEAEAALAAGRPRDAVRAAWAWVAWTLHERAIARYEPDLTNREFVLAVGRESPGWPPLPGLKTFARKVDGLCYDDAEPTDADARALLALADRMIQVPA